MCHTSFHCYADDLQINLSLKGGNCGIQNFLLDGICNANQWLNQILWIKKKKEEILFGQNATTDIRLLHFKFKDTATNLRVIFHKEFKFNKHIDSVVKWTFYHLCL